MPFGTVSAPPSNTGYNRRSDWPVVGGIGVKVDGLTAGMGGGVNLASTIAPNASASTSQWHPTIKWMLGFVIAELIVFHMASKFLNL